MKIAFLIPTTSNKRDEWKNIKDSYLYKILINSFITKQDNEHTYNFYIGYDKGDRIFSNKKERDIIDKVSKIFTNFKFIFYEFKNIKKGHVTKMWNELCKEAYNDNCDYYFQIGDDIKFHTKGFINDSIKILQKNNNVGMTGPINNNNQILTQCFVSKKHIEILGYFFPEEIINWCCDDWYNYLYKPNNFFPLKNHYASNDGGEPRYIVNDDKNFMNINNVRENVTKLREYSLELANRDRKKIEKYIEKKSKIKKIISFSLWGDNPIYTVGAIENVKLAKKIFPDWICRFYIPKNISKITNKYTKEYNEKNIRITKVPQKIINELKKLGAEIIIMDKDGCWYSSFWRFFAIEDADIVIFRDTDSRLSYREKYAVQDWINSNKLVHIMRDHKWHTRPILAGMWGLKKGILDNIRQMINKYANDNIIGYYQIDQDFLKDKIYPLVINNSIIHNEFIKGESFAKSFPTKRYKNQYVGQPYDENNKTLITITKNMDCKTIKEYFEEDK